ncbi:IS3 family transposase [Peribacillus sp. FSL H8-0477]
MFIIHCNTNITFYNYYNNRCIKQKLAGMSPVQYRLHTSQSAA